jgi:hypothetical protein
MDKTLHKKLTEIPFSTYSRPITQGMDGDMFSMLREEKKIINALKQDLLQPRPEAVNRLLELARAI